MAKLQVDKYSNVLIGAVTESAANTLTFEQLPQMTTLMEKKAFLINSIEYFLSNPGEFTAAGDLVQFGLSLSSQWATPAISEPSVVDFNYWYTLLATAVGFEMLRQPLIKDFSTLPGGGKLVPTRPMFLWAKANGFAAVSTITMRMHFTIVDLSPQDYWDLVEALSPIT